MFDEDKFNSLKKYLDDKAKYLGEDDKDVHFYIFPDKLLKVTDNISKESAKITLKLNKIGQGSDFEEIEIPINQSDVDKAVKVFNSLEMTDNIIHSFQSRHNYLYKDVEIALKYSSEWKHHAELEVLIFDNSQKEKAEKQIHDVADELDIKLMTEQELKRFVEKVEEEKKKERASKK